MNGKSLASGPCRCAEGQADKCPPPVRRSLGSTVGGRSCNFLSFYLAFVSLCTATHAYICQLCTAIMFVNDVQSVLCCTEILYSTIFLSFYLAVTSLQFVQFVLFVLLCSTKVHLCTNKRVCTSTAVTWQSLRKPLTHLIQKREIMMMKCNWLSFLSIQRRHLSGWRRMKKQNS